MPTVFIAAHAFVADSKPSQTRALPLPYTESMKSVDAGSAGDVERLYRDDGARLWRAILFLSGDPWEGTHAHSSTGVRRARLAFRYGEVTEAGGGVYAVFLAPSRQVGGLIQISPGRDCLG